MLIAMVGVLLSALISYYISRRNNYINTVTAARINWIGNLKSNIANLYGQFEHIDHNINLDPDYMATDDYGDKIKELARIATLIKLKLNPFNIIDKNLINILDQIVGSANFMSNEIPSNLCKSLVLHAQWLFKTEWEEIKIETAGFWWKPFLKFKVRRLMHRYEEFENSAN